MMQQEIGSSSKAAAVPANIANWWHKLPVEWKDSLLIVLIGRLFYSIWGVVIWRMGIISQATLRYYADVKPVTEGLPGALLGMWQRWDSVHYQWIAINGYTTDTFTAFFPGYPFLGRLVYQLTGMNIIAALLLVGNIALLLSLVLLHKIITEYFSLKTARGSLLTLAIFPSSFYFFAIFPMSLALLLVLASFWFAHQRRWLFSALAGLGAGLTHSMALPLLILVGIEVFEYIRSNQGKARWITLVVPFFSLLGNGIFYAWRIANTTLPFSDVYGWYGRSFSWPWDTLKASFLFIFAQPFQLLTPFEFINFSILLLTIILFFWNVRKMPIAFLGYQAACIVMLTSSISVGIPLLSLMRYALIVFPLFIEIETFSQNKVFKLLMFTLFLLLNLILTSMFLTWNGAVA